jgi:glycogen synthase
LNKIRKLHEFIDRLASEAILGQGGKTLALYQQPGLLQRYRQNAMKTDFSWNQTVGEYLKIYKTAEKISSGRDLRTAGRVP